MYQHDTSVQCRLVSCLCRGHSSNKVIGQTTALIPEAGLAKEALQDGQSANTNFPFADFKALATIGEVDAVSGLALTGYPDGQAAWLADNETVRVVYQSESYATMGSAPQPETYPWKMKNGVSFTGSHIHTINYDRAGFADFMNSKNAAKVMVTGSGKLFDTVYNGFGEIVSAPSFDPASDHHRTVAALVSQITDMGLKLCPLNGLLLQF